MSYRVKHYRGGSPPPQFVVNHAVSVAVKKTGADFNDVMSSHRLRSNARQKIILASHARIYAGLALRALYIEQCDDYLIARMLFAAAPVTWFYQVDARMRRKELRWWNDEIFMAVLEETEKVISAARRKLIDEQQAAE